MTKEKETTVSRKMKHIKKNTAAFHPVFSFQVLSYFKFIVNIMRY